MYQVGDKVIHRAYGLGEVIKVDEKRLTGRAAWYYVIQVKNLTLWIPIEEAEKHSLRLPTPQDGFTPLFAILRGAGEKLSEDRFERKTILTERMRDGSLESACRVIRDLATFSYKKKLNENDVSLMEHARTLLVEEWGFSLSVPQNDAQAELDQMLEEGRSFLV